MGDLGQLIVDNWTVVKTNLGLFITFGIIIAGVIWGVINTIYEKFLYPDLPEKRVLQKAIDELTEERAALQKENAELTNKIRELTTNARLLNTLTPAPQGRDIGSKIASANSVKTK